MANTAVFIKPGNYHVERLESDEIVINDGMGVQTRVSLTRRQSSVNVAARRSCDEEEEYPYDVLTPNHSETVIAGSKIRASFRH